MARKQPLTIIDVMQDPALFGNWFQGQSWASWRVFLKALFSVPFTGNEPEVFRTFTHRGCASAHFREAWLVVGRRGGKSIIAALVAVFLSCFRDYSKALAPGERGTLMIIAADRRQARVVFRYILGFLEAVPMLARMIERKTAESIDLSNQVTIEVHTASFRSTRGYSIVAAICDEIAFWRSEESANPDTEIINALRPGMSTFPDSKLICISSPYARRGELWNVYAKAFGKDDPSVLVWQADTRSMNPTVPENVIQQALEQDESAARAEYFAQFRRDIESYIQREAVEAVLDASRGRRELPVITGGVRYLAFVDPSGGSQDSMTLAIAHRESDKVVVDLLREAKPPFSPEAVTKEFAAVMRQYRVHVVFGDRYGGEWPREQFAKMGIHYRVCDKPKSDLYRDLLPLLNSGRVELLDHPRLIAQLLNLERRTSRSGKDSIDHAPGGHDDLINAAAGAIVLASRFQKAELTWGRENDEPARGVDSSFAEALRAGRLTVTPHKVIGD